jgi:hypothetical protein
MLIEGEQGERAEQNPGRFADVFHFVVLSKGV